MLVLSRKNSERIRLTGGIVLTVIKIRGGSVRIGVEAPEGVRIMRDEIGVDVEAAPLPAEPLDLPPPPRKPIPARGPLALVYESASKSWVPPGVLQ